jgi:predicted  nucleic acid-binding Zn-ribbon protein
MLKILLALSIVLILGSAFLGFKTKEKLEKLKGDIANSNSRITSLEGELKTAREEGNTALAALLAAEEKAEEAETKTNQMRDDLNRAQGELETALAANEEKDKHIEALEAELASLPENEMNLESAPEVTSLQEQLFESQAQLAEARQVSQSLESRLDATESEMAQLRREAERRERQQLAANLTGQILAVNRNWNFVVLSIGDRHGAVVGGEMIVARNNASIAKVRITSVEPTTSIADVIPGSVSRGALVQPGDMVIYPGSRQ